MLHYYISQGGYVFVVVFVFVSLLVCLLATLRKKIPNRSTRIRIRIRIMTLVRRVLAEVCTVPVLLVDHAFVHGCLLGSFTKYE